MGCCVLFMHSDSSSVRPAVMGSAGEREAVLWQKTDKFVTHGQNLYVTGLLVSN